MSIGLTLLAIFAGSRVHGIFASRAALLQFASVSQAAGKTSSEPGVVNADLWSEERIEAYRKSLKLPVDGPLAVLRIPRLSLEVPVFDGTDETVLNRGLGRIEGTARPGQEGNIGIAGHRDGFLRCLRDIQIGDKIELTLPDGTATYVVEKTEIVLPEDVSVLEPRKKPALTLVTCYPFYYVGHAPKRFIVHASIAEPKAGSNSQPAILNSGQPTGGIQ